MNQTLIYTVESQNLYLYDNESKISMLIDPKLKKAHEGFMDVDPYYYKKYRYLKEKGFFNEIKPARFESITPSIVKENIIQCTNILFEVTDSCNLNCTYCGYGKLYEVFDAREGKNINVRNAEKFLEYIYDLKLKNSTNKLVIGFYGGEPLLNYSFIKRIIDKVNQLNMEKEIDISYSMTTNATLIHNYIDFLVENEFEILISLDGNEENHSYRVFNDNSNSFHKVIQNIDMIQREYPQYFAKYISFNAVLHDRNTIKEAYEFIYFRYNKIPAISELISHGVRSEKKDVFEKMHHSKIDSEDEYYKKGPHVIPDIHYESSLFEEVKDFLEFLSVNYYVSNIISLFGIEEKNIPTSTCLPFSLKIFLTTNNKLLPCERISHEYFLGDVNEDIFIDTQEIAKRYNSYYEYLKQVCQNCYSYRFCGLCMFRIKNLNKQEREKFVCDRFYDQKKFEDKLSRIFSFLEKYPEDSFNVLEKKISR